MIITDSKGPSKPPRAHFFEASHVIKVVTDDLDLQAVETSEAKANLVGGFLRAALDAKDPQYVSQVLNPARELLGLGQTPEQAQGILEHHLGKRKAPKDVESKGARLHLARLAALSPEERAAALANGTQTSTDYQAERNLQKTVWMPAAVDALHDFLRNDRDEALKLATELGLRQATIGGAALAEDSDPGEMLPSPEIPRTSTRRRLLFLAASGVALAIVAIGIWKIIDSSKPDEPYKTVVTTDYDAIETRNELTGGEYLFSSAIQDVEPPPVARDTCYDRYQWAHANGAIDVGSTLTRVSITPDEGHTVVIVGAKRVAIEPDKSPNVGHVATCGGKGASPVRHISIDLDKGEKTYFDGTDDQPKDLHIPIDSGKTEVIDIQAFTIERSWTYKVELTLVVDGEERTLVIDDNGKPFRTTAVTNAKQYRWQNGAWVEVGPEIPAVQPSSTEYSKDMPVACNVLARDDVIGILGGQLEQSNSPPSVGTMDTGVEIGMTDCVYRSPELGPNMTIAQLSIMEPVAPEDAKPLYDDVVRKVGGEGKNEELREFSAQITYVDGSRAIIFHKDRTVDISITRNGNQSDPNDKAKVGELVRIVLGRL
ncbi:hypothetical protein IOD16_30875 [Saccharothrix sp. 6-C]|uniref:hypothetical protein n=1 Tax=Saccharothrix sp. 6-C TaxID=2781735 RepID=UPI001916F727|nr:hypothetical protein [Saccharothrix sp. 6-C]QQQ75458.1 hypothetical protein IOD16_30875 [Saccharothrix sp. 6-C]